MAEFNGLVELLLNLRGLGLVGDEAGTGPLTY